MAEQPQDGSPPDEELEPYDEEWERRVRFGPRSRAYVVDAFLAMLGYAGIVGVAGNLAGSGAPTVADVGASMTQADLRWLAGDVWLALYFLIEAPLGASPGKIFLGLEIGRDDAVPAGWLRRVLRTGYKSAWAWLAVLADAALMLDLAEAGRWLLLAYPFAGVVFLLGCVAAMGDRRQALHDLLTDTAVYRRETLRSRQA